MSIINHIPKGLDKSDTIGGKVTNIYYIRDDIFDWIESLGEKPEQKQALIQMARAFQSALMLDILDADAFYKTTKDFTKATNCLFLQYAPDEAADYYEKLETFIVNTQIRHIAYNIFNVAYHNAHIEQSIYEKLNACECDKQKPIRVIA